MSNDKLRALHQALLSVNAVAIERGDKYGVCDQIDNSGQPYQSQWLADLLKGAAIDEPAAAQESTGYKLVPTDLNSVVNMGWVYLDKAREVSPFKEWAFCPEAFIAAIASAPAAQPAPAWDAVQVCEDVAGKSRNSLFRSGAKICGAQILALQVQPALSRQELQAEGNHSAPCARHCEATAFNIEINRLNSIINTPQSGDFLRAVSIEAEHQRQRWGTTSDAGKTPADWFWLIGYLAGKALHAHAASNTEKAEHHIITAAAACANWHHAMFGRTDMRPGIDGEAAMRQSDREERA